MSVRVARAMADNTRLFLFPFLIAKLLGYYNFLGNFLFEHLPSPGYCWKFIVATSILYFLWLVLYCKLQQSLTVLLLLGKVLMFPVFNSK